MTISYNWLSEYLPLEIDPERLSRILTSVGLEVEKMIHYEEVKGGLEGLVIGDVIDVQPHPNADKLRLTKVKTGHELLQIVCGAPNVAKGQKVVVAPIGTTIYPLNGDPLTMKLAKIRGEESHGMICAEDEIGIGESHDGIMVLPADVVAGTPAADYFKPYTDVVYEIGLTPNRMDAMSHWGVARDVCAYISHHDRIPSRPRLPQPAFKVDSRDLEITVTVENTDACKRYSGVCISGVQVGPSPDWLQRRLKAIGLRPINNIVDITNYVLHETGQPLHAFDYDKIHGHTVVVRTLAEGSKFTTLDEKERTLGSDDLMICDGKDAMCIAGVFGGVHSGVTERTHNIFLESACFDPVFVRKTSFRHGLRTDAAVHFEKGTDVSATLPVLKRAAMLIKEIAGGHIASEVLDVYPFPKEKTQVALTYQYLKKLSGKNYHPETVSNILQSLDFVIVKEGLDAVALQVPFHKPDVSLPADVVEEILRIDGLDNIDIPKTISITPSLENRKDAHAAALKEKLAGQLTGLGFSEIVTNSLTSSAYFDQGDTVKLLNNLSVDLDAMRPSLFPTALEVIAHNVNRKNDALRLFEFAKTYRRQQGVFEETEYVALYLTGAVREGNWKEKEAMADVYYLKGVAEALLQAAGGSDIVNFTTTGSEDLEQALEVRVNGVQLVKLGKVNAAWMKRFDLKQPVYIALFNWAQLQRFSFKPVRFSEIPRYPAVARDLAMVVDKGLSYGSVQDRVRQLRLKQLRQVKLFDVFESEKIGKDKKSLAVNFIFQDEEKTLTDKEIDKWMQKIMHALEQDLQAEIRK